MRRTVPLLLAFVLLVITTVSVAARPVRPGDINVPDGFAVDIAISGLAAPTMVSFDDQGRMLIAESGYGGAGDTRVTRIEPDGKKTVLTKPGVFGTEVPLTSVAFHNGQVYAVHAGTVSIVQ